MLIELSFQTAWHTETPSNIYQGEQFPGLKQAKQRGFLSTGVTDLF